MLEAYLARLGLSHRPGPTAAGLEHVQRAHRRAIGFENFDVMLGRPIAIEASAVWSKLGRRRGGYCFEHNALFGAMLAELGLANRPLLARVWLGLDRAAGARLAPPKTHTLRLVTVGDALWLGDAGFGGSYVPPLPLVDGAEARTPDGARHRLTRSGIPGTVQGEWLLERQGPAAATDGRDASNDAWVAQYSFDLGEVTPVDLELSNWWTSTRPDTRFTSACIASAVLEDGFATVQDRRLSVHAAGATTVTDLASPQSWRAALAELFQIELAADEVDRLSLF